MGVHRFRESPCKGECSRRTWGFPAALHAARFGNDCNLSQVGHTCVSQPITSTSVRTSGRFILLGSAEYITGFVINVLQTCAACVHHGVGKCIQDTTVAQDAHCPTHCTCSEARLRECILCLRSASPVFVERPQLTRFRTYAAVSVLVLLF